MTIEEIAVSDFDCPGIHDPAPLKIVTERMPEPAEEEIRSIYSEVYDVPKQNVSPDAIKNITRVIREYQRRQIENQRHVKITREGTLMVRFELEGYPKFKMKSEDIIWSMSDCKKVIYATIEQVTDSLDDRKEGNAVLML